MDHHLGRLAPEMGHDPASGRHGPTGRTFANVQLEIRIRDFSLIQGVQAVLDGHDDLQLHFATWQADPENPAWRRVRAEAIRDALRRADDYADALGGVVLRIQHIADTGLLGNMDQGGARRLAAARAAPAAAPPGDPGPPRLDPVPQVLAAVIEARLVASAPRVQAQ